MLWLNYIVAACLLLSCLAAYISPNKIWVLAFFGISFPVIIAVNIFFAFYWLLRFRRQVFISLIALGFGIGSLKGLIQIENHTTVTHGSKAFKVMSYNVRLFDLYNWNNNKATRNQIFTFIKNEAPAIICLQEVYVDDKKEFQTMDTLVKLQAANNMHIEYTTTVRKIYHWGIATLTKYPILAKGLVTFNSKSNNSCIYTDLLIDTDTVRVYNMHLQSILFSKDDYKFMENLEQNIEVEEIEGSKSILRRLKRAFVKRSLQAEAVEAHIRLCPYPVIVCGDFNDTPTSYTYHTISDQLNDAFIESGSGLGRSYTGKFPSFRIDYILHSPLFKATEFKTHKKELSDHYPVSCYLEKTGANK